jgi:competence protein ComEC
MSIRSAACVFLLSALLPAGARAQEAGRSLEIRWIDVEGGAATLVVTPERESLLMDCGWPGERDAMRIARAVAAAGLKQIDHYVTSHYHLDHWGGLAELVERVPLKRFYYHEVPGPESKDVDAKLKAAFLKAAAGRSVVVKAGDTIPLKGASVKVLCADALTAGETKGSPQTRACAAHPAKPDDTSDNARSIGFLLEYKGFRFLNLGDLTWNVEHKLVCPENLIGAVDVYQTTHHGLTASNHPALLAAVAPTVAVMNNGAKKGGQAGVVKDLRALPSLKALFQVHRNVQTGPGDNAAPEFVANDEEKCEGHGIVLSVEPDGKRYRVEVPSKGTTRSFETTSR